MTVYTKILTPSFFVAIAVTANQDSASAPLGAREWASLVALGLAGMYFSQLFDFLGLQYVSAGIERTILFLYPTFAVVFSALLAGKAIGRREIMALALSYAGIVLVAAQEITFGSDTNTLVGAVLVLISAMTYAGYLVGSGQTIHRVGTQRFTGYTMIVACVAVLAHFSVTHPVSSLDLPVQVYVLGFAMAMVSTVLPIILLNAGIRRIGGSKASLVGSVGPVSTVLLAAIFLDEAITLKQVLGTALVLAGVLAITVPAPVAKVADKARG